MDFKKILASFDAVENDTSASSVEKKRQAGSMLAILESFNRVEAEAVEETAEETLDESKMADMMIAASEMSKEEFAKEYPGFAKDYEKLRKRQMEEESVEESAEEELEVVAEETEEEVEESAEEELEEAIMVSAEGDEAAQLLSILQLAGMKAPEPAMPAPMEPEMEMQDEYSNSPDEVEQDVDAVIASGDDLHREKGQYAAAARGDNPMKAFEGKFKSILDELLAEEEK
jgi:hypothetical protein